MPLDRQVITMPLAQGVDTKTDSKQVVAGKLLELENGVFTKLKAIQKRNGYEALSRTVLNPAPTGEATRPGALTAEMWYKLNDGAAPAVNSGSGGSANLTVTGGTATWTNAMPGLTWANPTLYLDGSTTLVAGGASLDPLNGSTTCTISYWSYLTNIIADGYILVRGSQFLWLFENVVSPQPLLFRRNTESFITSGITSSDVLNKVAFVAIVCDGTNTIFYLNGQQVSTHAGSAAFNAAAVNLQIGGASSGFKTPTGYISNLIVSSSATSPEIILAQYNTGIGA